MGIVMKPCVGQIKKVCTKVNGGYDLNSCFKNKEFSGECLEALKKAKIK